MTFLYHADRQRGAIWADLFARKAPDIGFAYDRETVAPEEVRFLGIWHPPSDMLTRYESLEVVFSLGAGVDQFDVSAFPDDLPLVRMIEPGITQGMAEYIALAVMTLHRHFIDYHRRQTCEAWEIQPFRPCCSVRVGFLGTGVLAQGAFPLLRCAGFPLQAWSRTEKTIPGVTCHSGEEGLRTLLAETDILVSVLTLTDETRGILNRDLFERLPRGAAMVNCGRGAHLINDDLLEALASGQLSRAVLDVTEPEPLSSGHPFWTHPKILMTPHTASMTQPDTAVDAVIANIRRHQAGEEMIGLVDRKRR